MGDVVGLLGVWLPNGGSCGGSRVGCSIAKLGGVVLGLFGVWLPKILGNLVYKKKIDNLFISRSTKKQLFYRQNKINFKQKHVC